MFFPGLASATSTSPLLLHVSVPLPPFKIVLSRPFSSLSQTQMVLLELTDFLWFLSGLLKMSPGAFFEKLNRGVDRFGGSVFGVPNWGSRR